jgi:hypothetical protein
MHENWNGYEISWQMKEWGQKTLPQTGQLAPYGLRDRNKSFAK